MDVGSILTTSYSLPHTTDFRGAPVSNEASGNTEIPLMNIKEKSLGNQVRAEMIMNLQEMQNFLYMLIGSKLRIQTDNNTIGSSVNTAA
jgi:hypothetical protein